MKNSQKGFIVPVLLVVIALLVVGGGVYFYESKKTETPTVMDTGTQQPSQNQQQTKIQSDTSSLNSYTHYDSGITFKYPKDWKFDATKNYFTTSDYQEGQSGARIEFIYGFSGNGWQGMVSAMYGSNSVNTQTSISGKSVLRTTYPSDDHLIALSFPFANNTSFMSLLLKYQAPGRLVASYKDSYEPVLQTIAENAVLPSTTSSSWHTYLNSTYNFSFKHPADASISSVTQRQTSDGTTINELIVTPAGVDPTRVHFFTTSASLDQAKNIKIYGFAKIKNSEFTSATIDGRAGTRRIDNYLNNDCTNELTVVEKNGVVYGVHIGQCPTHWQDDDQLRKDIANSLELM